ncbi:MAG: bifunctional adenosylcobinamide kinase/adenosylcobinamide-phosphate guanylyltransferase [Oscillospiraceae bacterium]
MVLIVGGKAQGKLGYVKSVLGVSDGEIARDADEARTARVFDGCSRWVRMCLQAGEDADALMDALLEANPDLVLIFDEVGCGVVPVDKEERLWRETVGRMTCRLAQRAERVERVLCGLPMTLKGEGTWN